MLLGILWSCGPTTVVAAPAAANTQKIVTKFKATADALADGYLAQSPAPTSDAGLVAYLASMGVNGSSPIVTEAKQRVAIVFAAEAELAKEGVKAGSRAYQMGINEALNQPVMTPPPTPIAVTNSPPPAAKAGISTPAGTTAKLEEPATPSADASSRNSDKVANDATEISSVLSTLIAAPPKAAPPKSCAANALSADEKNLRTTSLEASKSATLLKTVEAAIDNKSPVDELTLASARNNLSAAQRNLVRLHDIALRTTLPSESQTTADVAAAAAKKSKGAELASASTDRTAAGKTAPNAPVPNLGGAEPVSMTLGQDLPRIQSDLMQAGTEIANVAGLGPVKNTFFWIGYQAANPYAFTPSGADATDSNGTISSNTNYDIVMEVDYLNRLAWDPIRRNSLYDNPGRFLGDPTKTGFLNPANLTNWDIEARIFFSLSSGNNSGASTGSSGNGSGASGSGSGGLPTVKATSLEGSGNFGVEAGIVQNLVVTDSDPYNFQTFGLEERLGAVSDRTAFRNHPDYFLGTTYAIGYWPNRANSSEPVRVDLRYGIDWLDATDFVPSKNSKSTDVYTEHNVPVFKTKLYWSAQGEIVIPVGKTNFLEIGGRVYFGNKSEPAPWTSYIGYAVDIDSIAQALGFPSNKAGSTAPNPSPQAQPQP